MDFDWVSKEFELINFELVDSKWEEKWDEIFMGNLILLDLIVYEGLS